MRRTVGRKILGGLIGLFLISRAVFAEVYTAGEHYLLKDGEPFLVKGVVYVPVYPGFLPWQLAAAPEIPERLKQSIRQDLQNIKAMGTNTVRFWDVPLFCYQAIKEMGGLVFIQTIWFDGSQKDFQAPLFKERCRQAIAKTIDRIYTVYSKNDPPPLLAFLIGNELSAKSIENTNQLHPEIHPYQGTYVSAPKGSTATECFLAEMADFLKTYEKTHYGRTHLVSYANEIRTQPLLDAPFLDFRSFNAYSYAISDYQNPKEGSVTKTLFQGWIEDLKNRYPGLPLLITETGLSVSPNATHIGAPDYGYGGNTEAEQAEGLLQNWKDLTSTPLPIAGVCAHEYLDAWWKFGLKDSYRHDPGDAEEWFGLVSIEKEGDWYQTRFRESYFRLKEAWSKKFKKDQK